MMTTSLSLFCVIQSVWYVYLLLLLNVNKVESRGSIFTGIGVDVDVSVSSNRRTRTTLTLRNDNHSPNTSTAFSCAFAVAPKRLYLNRPQTQTPCHRQGLQKRAFYTHDCPTKTSTSTSTSTTKTRICKRSSSSTKLSSLSIPSVPLISSTDHWGNIAALCTTASVAQSLGKTTAIGRLLGPPVTAMAMAFLLGSIGILPPGGSEGAKTLQLLSIQLATPLLLLSVDIRECRKRCGPLLLAFTLAAASTVASSALAAHLCARPLLRALGRDGLGVAAALMAKNVGGGLNYVAVCRSLGVGTNAIAAGLCVDNVMALVYFPVTSAMAAGRPDVVDAVESGDSVHVVLDVGADAHVGVDVGADTDADSDVGADVGADAGADVGADADGNATYTTTETTDAKTTPQPPKPHPITIETISKSLALATTATYLGEHLGGPSYALPLSTLLTLLYTTLNPSTPLTLGPTGNAIGTSLLYLFFATAGAPGLSVAKSVRSAFLPIAGYLTVLYAGHGSLLCAARWVVLRRARNKGGKGGEVVAVPRLLVASSASIGGPATAAALAQANGWRSLVGPSLVVGNVGYAVATFVGIVFYSIVSKLYL